MLDINLIREKPEWVKAQIAKLNDSAPIDEIIAADARRREIVQEVEELRRQRNVASKEIGHALGALRKTEADLQRAEADQDVGQALDLLRTQVNAMRFNAEEAKEKPRLLGEQISVLEEELRAVEADLRQKMLWVPNIPDESVPVAPDDSHNINYPPQGAPEALFDFEPQAHWDLGPGAGHHRL